MKYWALKDDTSGRVYYANMQTRVTLDGYFPRAEQFCAMIQNLLLILLVFVVLPVVMKKKEEEEGGGEEEDGSSICSSSVRQSFPVQVVMKKLKEPEIADSQNEKVVEGWQRVWSNQYSQWYYYHKKMNLTTWDSNDMVKG